MITTRYPGSVPSRKVRGGNRSDWHAAFRLVKDRAAGRWREILHELAGIPLEYLTGKHTPCPRCGGKDRWQFLGSDDGAAYCRHCLTEKCGDGIAVIARLTNISDGASLKLVATHLGIYAEALEAAGVSASSSVALSPARISAASAAPAMAPVPASSSAAPASAAPAVAERKTEPAARERSSKGFTPERARLVWDDCVERLRGGPRIPPPAIGELLVSLAIANRTPEPRERMLLEISGFLHPDPCSWVLEYLLGRGLLSEGAGEGELLYGVADPYGGNTYLLAARLWDADSGDLVNVQSRGIRGDEPPDKKVTVPWHSRVAGTLFSNAYGLEVLQGGPSNNAPIILGEGLTDFIALASVLEAPVFSIPGTTNAGSAIGSWARGRTVLIATDTDSCGEEAARVAAEGIRGQGGRPLRVRWPEGCKDACDVVRMLGLEGLGSELKDSISKVLI